MTNDETRALALRAIGLLDLTDLSDACNPAAVVTLCQRAVTPHGPVAAICIWPQFVSSAKKRLAESGVRLATVINFPKGGDDVDRAVTDTREALKDGADEIDLVMPYKAFLAGDEAVAKDMIEAVGETLPPGGLLKVILETGALGDDAHIARAAELALKAGAHFIKTSTGKIAVSATPAAARAMLEAIKAAGGHAGFKAAGGIRTLEDAALYLGLADSIMGAGWADARHFRIGASGLLDVLLAALDGGEAKPQGGY
jgi:deoxyribose-phosphate aldolase